MPVSLRLYDALTPTIIPGAAVGVDADLQVGGNHGMFQQLARGWRMTIPLLGNGPDTIAICGSHIAASARSRPSTLNMQRR